MMKRGHERTAERRIKPLWWDSKERLAKSYMEDRRAIGATETLLAIAGQHPSIEGIYPKDEYRMRLDTAIDLARDILAEGGKADFCVLSSRVVDEDTGIADKVALADAGAAYLIAQGIDPEVIHAEWNEQYKGEDGVYTGGDEAFVVSRAFRDSPQYRDLIFIASPGQLGRARLNFTANEVYPEFRIPESINSVEQHHSNRLKELRNIFYTWLLDPDWQKPNGMMMKARDARKPQDGIGSQIPLDELIELYKKRYPIN